MTRLPGILMALVFAFPSWADFAGFGYSNTQGLLAISAKRATYGETMDDLIAGCTAIDHCDHFYVFNDECGAIASRGSTDFATHAFGRGPTITEADREAKRSCPMCTQSTMMCSN